MAKNASVNNPIMIERDEETAQEIDDVNIDLIRFALIQSPSSSSSLDSVDQKKIAKWL